MWQNARVGVQTLAMAREETVHRRVGGRYTLLEPLGRGGMGTVWRAFDELLQRHVAVKHVAIPPALEGPEEGPAVRDRVMREARAAARLSHHASVTVFDALEDDGNVYIVMELVEADNLAEVVERDGPLATDEAARVGLELVGALEAAHRQGIVHRDVKPSNVMMLPNGTVKLTDFGIASVKDHPNLTGTGQVVGSPAYMSPEQALSERSGPSADWWALGATLYFAVEGRPPFERPGALATLTAVVHEDPAPTQQAGALAPLLGRLLAKDAELRPGAPELRKLLRRLSDPAGTTFVDDDEPEADTATASVTATAVAAPAPPAPPPVAETVEARPAPPEAPPPPPPGRTRRERPAAPVPPPGRGNRAYVPAIVVLFLVAVVLAALLVARADGGDGTGSEEPAASSETTAAAEAAEKDQDDDDGRGSQEVATEAEGVPDDWVEYTDPRTGYRIARPAGWQVRQLDRTRTDIRDPETGSYLRIDWTDTPGPSPEGAWEAQSKSFGARHEAYEEIRIEPTTYKDHDAAIWEYAYSAGGARLHAVNLGMVTDTYGFALNFQTDESRWEGSQDTFDAFKESFRIPD